jgi:aspartokinase-like uncharacterized kinase
MCVRVIKLGGSLLEWPELSVRLRRWLAVQSPAVNVLIVGGGPIVEGLRTIDRVQQLSASASHWLAIRAMGLSARVLADLLSDAPVVDSLAAIDLNGGSTLQIFEVEPLLRAEQGSASALPESWDVTSDSIAAHVANQLAAAELVLLKSAPAPEPPTAESLARHGYVDAYFPKVARNLPVRCIDLRHTQVESAD